MGFTHGDWIAVRVSGRLPSGEGWRYAGMEFLFADRPPRVDPRLPTIDIRITRRLKRSA